jgi:hypothetical protein
MIFERHLVNQEHVHRFLVARDLEGWHAREEEDSIVIRAVHHDDWHRVERTVRRFEAAASALEERGWADARVLSAT